MWEDTFAGVCKFHVRWLVHSSDIPKAFARLQAARRAIAVQQKTERSSDDENMKETSPPSGHADEHDGNEVFLTSKMGDIEIRFVVKSVTLSFAICIPTKLPAHVKGKRRPLLAHAFDGSTGDFVPVELTNSIVQHPRARDANAIAQELKLAEEALAANSEKGKRKGRGWLLPKRTRAEIDASGGTGSTSSGGGSGGGSGSGTLSSTTAAMSEYVISKSDGEASNRNISNDAREEAGESDGIESRSEPGHDDSNCSTDVDCQTLPDAPPSSRAARRRYPGHDDEELKRPRSYSDQLHGVVVAPPAQHLTLSPAIGTVKDAGPLRKRPRRLAMPLVDKGTTRPPRSSKRLSAAASPSRRRPSIRRMRTRGRAVKVVAEETTESDYLLRRTLVGEDHQVDIPDLLSVRERERANVAAPAGTGSKMVSSAPLQGVWDAWLSMAFVILFTGWCIKNSTARLC